MEKKENEIVDQIVGTLDDLDADEEEPRYEEERDRSAQGKSAEVVEVSKEVDQPHAEEQQPDASVKEPEIVREQQPEIQAKAAVVA